MTPWLLPLMLQMAAVTGSGDDPETLPRLTVSERAAAAVSITRLDENTIEQVNAQHPNQLFGRVPGTWISRGSGQEQLTAIRSPVLTGAGACGAFLFLENGVPIRPAGFCNVNQLFEINLHQAAAVEVLRGPGTVQDGSNALHGLVNVLQPTAGSRPPFTLALQRGSDDYRRADLRLGGEQFLLQTSYTDAGSFRQNESYQHGFLNLGWSGEWRGWAIDHHFAYADLDQETAGFILGFETYRDPLERRRNLNPEAFRDADAGRLSSRWRRQLANGDEIQLLPFARHSRMDFLQHFLPGKPLEQNGQDSAGLRALWNRVLDQGVLSAGIDLEWADGFLREFQDQPITDGSAFLQATRPAGLHYDYEVTSYNTAAFVHWQNRPSASPWRWTLGLRADYLHYDYDNLTRVGNTRQDGSECGFGGCLFNRPADRSDSFFNPTPQARLEYHLDDRSYLWSRLARGFRAPQATELYRLQRGQDVADLDSTTIDSWEVGFATRGSAMGFTAVAYWADKDDVILRDAEGFNVSDGSTSHRGVEATADYRFGSGWYIASNMSYAKHQYEFSRDIGRGEVIIEGNDVDTAPRWLGSARLGYRKSDSLNAELEWSYTGDYYLDAANRSEYTGHDLLHLRVNRLLDAQWRLGFQITNLTDERYAERADFAFGNFRYFPGAGRQFLVQLQYQR